ncbi:MAG: hypothetical protein NT144_11250, partial [Bacteroidia bacterium]|nr:hypothetical protein [Bacteroidia bacterium]
MKKKIILKRILHREKKRLAIVFDYDENLARLDEQHLKQILTVFREKADIDISAISTGEKGKLNTPSVMIQNDMDPVSLPAKPEIEEKTFKKEVAQAVKKEKNYSGFAPVLFTISETDGRLVIKFTGRYDGDWIKELKTFGKPWFDNVTHEWHLRWTQ